MKNNCAAARGFSLIELLVVIAILSVLMSLLLPSLSKAKTQAENLKCTAISRGLAVTMSSYFNDMKGFIPPLANPNPDGSPGAWGYNYGSWYPMLRPWLTLGNPNGNGTYRNDDARVTVCPSRVTGVYTYGYPYFQYAMPWNLRFRVGGNAMWSWRVDELQDLSSTGMFMDNGYYPDSIYYMSVGMFAQSDYVISGTMYASKQHNGEGISQTFMDGHSEFAVLSPASATTHIFPSNAKFNHRTFYGKTGLAPDGSGYLSLYYQFMP